MQNSQRFFRRLDSWRVAIVVWRMATSDCKWQERAKNCKRTTQFRNACRVFRRRDLSSRSSSVLSVSSTVKRSPQTSSAIADGSPFENTQNTFKNSSKTFFTLSPSLSPSLTPAQSANSPPHSAHSAGAISPPQLVAAASAHVSTSSPPLTPCRRQLQQTSNRNLRPPRRLQRCKSSSSRRRRKLRHAQKKAHSPRSHTTKLRRGKRRKIALPPHDIDRDAQTRSNWIARQSPNLSSETLSCAPMSAFCAPQLPTLATRCFVARHKREFSHVFALLILIFQVQYCFFLSSTKIFFPAHYAHSAAAAIFPQLT